MSYAPAAYFESSGGKTFNAAFGTDRHDVLGFTARSVIVDNRTTGFIYIPAAGRYVDPGLGMAAGCEPVTAGDVLWLAPPGKVQASVVATQVATVSWYPDPSPPGSALSPITPGFITTAAPIVVPNKAAPIVVTPGASFVYGAWAQLAAAGVLPSDPAGLSQIVVSSNGSTGSSQIQLGTGAAGSEVGIGEWPYNFQAGSVVLAIGIFPLISISGNPRIAARVAQQFGNTVNVQLGIYSLPL